MQPSRFGRRRFPPSELYPSFRSTILSCFRLLYFRVLASRIPSVLLGTSALLVTAFCTEIFQLSIPIGYPYSRERHPQGGATSSIGLQVTFEGALAETEYRATSDAVHLSANASVDKDQGQKGPIRPPYVWEEQRVCGAVPHGIDGSRVMSNSCRRHRHIRGQQGRNAPANTRSALDPRNFQKTASKDSPVGAGMPLCPAKPSAVCFPRVRGGRVCFRQDRAELCVKDAGSEAPTDGALALLLKVAKCQGGRVDKVDSSLKHSGLALIADDRFSPLSKPDPLGEAEKVIPALLLRQLHMPANKSVNQDWSLGRPQLFWLKDPATVTVWTHGLLKALNVSIRWRYNLHQGQESGGASEQAAVGRDDSFEGFQGVPSVTRNNTVHSQFLGVEGGARLAQRNESAGIRTLVTKESLQAIWEGGESVVSKSEGPVQAGSLRLDVLGGVLASSKVDTEERARAPPSTRDLDSNITDLDGREYKRPSTTITDLDPYTSESKAPLLGSLSEDGDFVEREGERLRDEPPFLNFVDGPWEATPTICFDDVVLLSSPTNGAFIPDDATNDWLRSQVLHHCGVKEELAPRVVKNAVILEPPAGQGSLINKAEMARLLTDIVGVEVGQKRIEGDAFCDQVRAIASEDFLVMPHGSLNVNLIFAKPGAIVMEVFPYLYYTNFIGNYIHATRLRHLQVLGTRPPWSPLLWIYSWLGWDTCFTVPACRDHARRQDIRLDTEQFETLLWQLVNDCVLVGEASPARCRN